jgi:hypothetical protein
LALPEDGNAGFQRAAGVLAILEADIENLRLSRRISNVQPVAERTKDQSNRRENLPGYVHGRFIGLHREDIVHFSKASLCLIT